MENCSYHRFQQSQHMIFFLSLLSQKLLPFHFEKSFYSSPLAYLIPASLLLCFGAIIIDKEGLFEHQHWETATADLITQTASKWLTDGKHWTKGWNQVGWSGMAQDFITLEKKWVPFKTCKLFTLGICHLVFSNCDWQGLTGTTESKTEDMRSISVTLVKFYRNCYFQLYNIWDKTVI